MITSDDVVNDKGELVHYIFYADIEPVNVTQTLNKLEWMQDMMEELKSIEVNKI